MAGRYPADRWQAVLARPGALQVTARSVPLTRREAQKLLEALHQGFPHWDAAIEEYRPTPVVERD